MIIHLCKINGKIIYHFSKLSGLFFWRGGGSVNLPCIFLFFGGGVMQQETKDLRLFCLNKVIFKDGGVLKISIFKYHLLF